MPGTAAPLPTAWAGGQVGMRMIWSLRPAQLNMHANTYPLLKQRCMLGMELMVAVGQL